MLKRNMYSMKQYAYYFVMPEYTFEKACNAAYADMSRHALRINNKNDSQKDTFRKQASDLLKVELEKLPNYKSCSDFDAWHKKVCNELIKIYKGCEDAKGDESFCYGHAQKWLNMLFKYIYVFEFTDATFKDYFDVREDVINCLHVPLDNKILEYAKTEFELSKPKCSWSKLSEKDYLDYQNKLKDKVRSNTKPPYSNPDGKIPFYWELMVWSTL